MFDKGKKQFIFYVSNSIMFFSNTNINCKLFCTYVFEELIFVRPCVTFPVKNFDDLFLNI